MIDWLVYLFEVSICHAFFCLLYLGLYRNLSFFQANRIYLLVTAVLGFVIPAIQIPFWQSNTAELLPIKITEVSAPFIEETTTHISSPGLPWLINLAFIVYLLGLMVCFWRLMSTIVKVNSLIEENKVDESDEVKTVHLKSGPTVFVFLNYVFINMNKISMSSEEFQQVIEHEKSHVLQRHTLDNVFMELAIIICWFNPFLRLMRRQLSDAHEFYADQKVVQNTQDLDSYSRLILRLSSSKEEHIPLTHQFSKHNIKQRITMLNKKKNENSHLLRYLVIVPCLAMLLVSFSLIEKTPEGNGQLSLIDTSVVIGKIAWKGNSRYTSTFLSDYMGISTGDPFNEAAINQKLTYQPDGSDLGSLYMDHGHLFFTVNVKKEEHSGTVDLTFEIFEGDLVTINKVFVTGSNKVDSEKMLSMISLKPGDPFNRSKLTASQQTIAESGLVAPDNVVPNLIPNPDDRTVDIEFKVRAL